MPFPRRAWKQTREYEVAEPLGLDFFVEELSEGQNRYKRRRVLYKQTTTDNYEVATESYVFDARLYTAIQLHVINEHTANAIKLQVLGTLDGVKWKALTIAGASEWTVNANSDLELSLTSAWAFLKIQVKAAVGGSQGIATGYIAGKSP